MTSGTALPANTGLKKNETLPCPQHHMVDEGKGLASHTHVLWASLPTSPSMGIPSSVLLRQGIGPTLLSSVSGEGLGQLFCLLQGTRGEQVAMGGIFRSPSPPHGRQGVQGQFPHSYNRTAGSPVPPPTGSTLPWCPGEVQSLLPFVL